MDVFELEELVTAAQCARQLALLRAGHNIDSNDAVVGKIAREVLIHLVTEGPRNDSLLRSLEPEVPAFEAVRGVCYRLAHAHAFTIALRAAATAHADALTRSDGVVRRMAEFFASNLVRRRATAATPEEAADTAFATTVRRVALHVGNVHVAGSLNLVGSEPTWFWHMTPIPASNPARRRIVLLFSLALESLDRPSNQVHIVNDDLITVDPFQVQLDDRRDIDTWLANLVRWTHDNTPPPADEPTCRSCPVQETCWAQWGRTLPDADQTPRRSALAPSPRPIPNSTTLPASESTPTLVPPTLWLGEERGSGRAATIDSHHLTNHIVLCGTSGCGKTSLAKTIIEESTLSGVPSLVLDLQGDLAQLASLGKSEKETLAIRRAAFAHRAEIRLLSPASNVGLRLSLNPLTLPNNHSNDEALSFCRLTMADALLSAMRIPDSWQNLAREYLAQLLTTDAGNASLTSLIHQVRNPSELIREPFMRSRTRREALAEQLRQLAEGTDGLLFDGERRLDINELITPFTPGKVPVNIVWLPALGDHHARHRFVAMILADIYAWMLRKSSTLPRLLVHFDEVSPFMPPIGDPPAKQVLTRILHDGRNHGVCALFCTQNFMDVDFKALAHAGTLLLGRLGSTQDKARVRKMLPRFEGFDPAAAAELLVGAPVGRFLRASTGQPPTLLQSRMPITLHARPWGEDEVRKLTSKSMRDQWLSQQHTPPN